MKFFYFVLLLKYYSFYFLSHTYIPIIQIVFSVCIRYIKLLANNKQFLKSLKPIAYRCLTNFFTLDNLIFFTTALSTTPGEYRQDWNKIKSYDRHDFPAALKYYLIN